MIFEEDFDGNNEAEKREAHLANKQVHTKTKPNIESVSDEQVEEMVSSIEVLDQRDVEGKPMGS